MLNQQSGIIFSGGLDTRLLQPWHIREFEALRIKELWFAADTPGALSDLHRAARLLESYPRRKKRCYVLIGFANETPREAEHRLQGVWDTGFLPFAQMYRGQGEQPRTLAWKQLQRLWSRPAAMFAANKRHTHMEL
ncbi:hypothetical protein ES703_118352 [subsurface metagenome]